VGRVLVTRHLPEGSLDPLTSAGHEIVQAAEDRALSPAELVAAAPEVDGIVCLLTDRIDAPVLEAGASGRLRVVANTAVGYDNIDVGSARRLAVAVCNTPGVLDQTTADLTLLLILAAARQSSSAEADLRAGRWTGWGISDHLGRDVHGALLGLVGYGRIARQVARRAEAFGMEVFHHTPHNTGFPGYHASLHDLLKKVDVVSLHVPLSPETHHLIGAAELAVMKPTAVLVNTARGPVVDEVALAAALESGEIYAAGIDVYEEEPAVSAPLLKAPRTVLLPHIGSATVQTRTKMGRLASQGVVDVLDGRQPANLVGEPPGT
jgi:glyoxylate reductase